MIELAWIRVENLQPNQFQRKSQRVCDKVAKKCGRWEIGCDEWCESGENSGGGQMGGEQGVRNGGG